MVSAARIARVGGPSAPSIRPMSATMGPLPDGPGWAFEFAWDGARAIADVSTDRVRLIGGDQGFAANCPELDVLRQVAGRGRLVLDGTIVVLDAFGRPSFARLQRRMAVQRPTEAMLSRLPVAYYVFDILCLGGKPTVDLPYETRRALLEKLQLPDGAVALAPSFTDTDGQAVLDTAARYGLHGVVAKRARSRYRPGHRSRSWVETALRRTQEVVIGGWLPDRAGAVRSVVVGTPAEGGLRFVGTVGPAAAGFDDAVRTSLTGPLHELRRPTSPFVGPGPPRARWVTPELLCEVSYRRRSPSGRLERPGWVELRPGRHPVEVPVVEPLLEPSAVALDEALRLARAEVDALRAQISPHFLYNVLSMVGSVIRTDPPLARELLDDFAQFTRYAFRTGVDLSTVADELDNVERYLTLQRARFGDRLRVELQVAPSVLPVSVPFLALQLAVEHAVQHSIEPKPGGGTLTVTAVDDGAHCRITISDDGVGAHFDGGLRSLDQRLRSAYGVDHALRVDTPAGGGTTVSFRVPVRR